MKALRGFAAAASLLVACAGTEAGFVSDAGSRDAGPVSVDRPAGVEAGVGFDVPTARDAGVDVAAVDAPTTDAGVTCTPPGEVPYASHTMREEFTDPPSCATCPRAFSNIGSLEVSTVPTGATTLRIEGVSAGASQCEWYVLGGNCGVTHGIASVDPDGAGTFVTTVPVFCGTNVVQVVCRNDAGRRVIVRRIEGTQCAGTGRDLRVTLGWDATSFDMELHLLRAAGRLNDPADDCTWFRCERR